MSFFFKSSKFPPPAPIINEGQEVESGSLVQDVHGVPFVTLTLGQESSEAMIRSHSILNTLESLFPAQGKQNYVNSSSVSWG